MAAALGWGLLAAALMTLSPAAVQAATEVPTDIQQPGTQPGEVNNLEGVTKCDNCHGNSSKGVELAHEWSGSMMAHAGRDPIFWATMAVAEQDFDGSGDLCLRCHATAGWIAGRSTPTDGSNLGQGDANAVECHLCHSMTNPNDSEHLGAQNAPFIANDGGSPAKGYYGSGMLSLWGGNEKLGPYANADATHSFLASSYHRSVDFCGSCHDVSNPAVGDLAHNNGTQAGAPSVVSSGVPGGPVGAKAAFNNFPHQYGVVERTFSEYKSGQLVETRVSDYATLPPELQAGAIAEAYNAALAAGNGGDYEDGATRFFSCQTCHMKPTTGVGCDKNGVITRYDLPLHDLTGGNYWMPQAIAYLDSVGKLRLGGDMSAAQTTDMLAGAARAEHQLEIAASLEATGTTLKVINLTGHKLISGYPEGRRMWLNVKWFDAGDVLLREDGAYGDLVDGAGQAVTVTNPANSQQVQVRSILDLDDPHLRIYEAHYGLTQQWASQLLGLGYPPGLALEYDRLNGSVLHTLGELGAQPPGTAYESFHFVLNNEVIADNRIPTWGMRYDDARIRNALPVPYDQYGDPGPGGVYQHWDEVLLAAPLGATTATVDLLYQPTSWEYIQFLYLANDGSITFLAAEGANMLEAWIETGMAEPHTMASTTITVPEPGALLSWMTGVGFLYWARRRRARP
jgi:cytochrome c2